MPYLFTVSPDFTPDHLSGWFIFNTWLQRALSEAFHLELYDDFQSQREAIQADQVDLIYANPYDAAMLVRDKGFMPLVTPVGHSDEAIIAVSADNGVAEVEALRPGVRLATTDDPDVHMMGMIMLEPADLNADNIQLETCDSYVLVAKKLVRGESDVGIFLDEAFNDLSSMVKRQLRILVSSQIQMVHHALMLGPKLAPHYDVLRQALLAMADDPKGQGVLHNLGVTRWEGVDQEEMEFMIDLMDTLTV